MTIRSAFLITLGVLSGLPVGTGVATFFYADGLSYFSNDATSCVNCHAMRDQYEAWKDSSHKTVAVCNDCHSNGHKIQRYAQKAINGALHSWAFTTGDYPEPIQIKKFNRDITQRSCLDCHQNLIESSQFSHGGLGSKNCLHCHKNVGH